MHCTVHKQHDTTQWKRHMLIKRMQLDVLGKANTSTWDEISQQSVAFCSTCKISYLTLSTNMLMTMYALCSLIRQSTKAALLLHSRKPCCAWKPHPVSNPIYYMLCFCICPLLQDNATNLPCPRRLRTQGHLYYRAIVGWLMRARSYEAKRV